LRSGVYSCTEEKFENPRLLREFGLITENLNGFNDLDSNFTLRGVPQHWVWSNSAEAVRQDRIQAGAVMAHQAIPRPSFATVP